MYPVSHVNEIARECTVSAPLAFKYPQHVLRKRTTPLNKFHGKIAITLFASTVCSGIHGLLVLASEVRRRPEEADQVVIDFLSVLDQPETVTDVPRLLYQILSVIL